MAALTITEINTTGNDGVAAPTLVSCAAGGDTVTPGDKVFLWVKNTNGAGQRVVVDSQKSCDQGVDHDIDHTVPATTGEAFIGPLPATRFRNSSNVVDISYPDGVTGMTIAALRLA